MNNIKVNIEEHDKLMENYQNEIISMVSKIHKEKFIRMIYGFVKKLYSIQEKEQA